MHDRFQVARREIDAQFLGDALDTEPRGFRHLAWLEILQRLCVGIARGPGGEDPKTFFRRGSCVRQQPMPAASTPRVWLLAMRLRSDAWSSRGYSVALTVRSLASLENAPARHVRALVGCRIVDREGRLRSRRETIVQLHLSPAGKIVMLSASGALIPRCEHHALARE